MGVSPSDFKVDNCSSKEEIDTLVLTSANVTKYVYSSFEEHLIRYVMPGILVICLLGNFAFFFTIVRVKRMRTVTNLYLMNLSIADICFLSIVVGEKSYRYYKVGVPSYGEVLGTWGCVVIYMTVYTAYFNSVIIVTLISVERYFAICKPLKHMIYWSKQRTLCALTVSWLLSTILASTTLPGNINLTIRCVIWPQNQTYQAYPSVIGQCYAINTGALAFENLIQTIPFFIASATNAIFYAGIILKMKSRARNSLKQKHSAKMRAKLLQVRNQVTRMLVINGIAFFCCQAPYEIGCFVFFVQTLVYDTEYEHTNDFLLKEDQYRTFLWVARLLLYVNAMLNPLIFNTTSPTYRKALQAAFTCQPNKLKKKSSNPPDDGMQTSEAVTCRTSL